MRIAQVSPLFEAVPPKLYGGTERIVSYLTEELIRQGHEVTLFASGDSETSARLVSPCGMATRLSGQYQDELLYHMVMFDQVYKQQDQFDIIHFHTDYFHFTMTRALSTPHVTTLHGRMDYPDYQCLYEQFADIPLISISESQKRPLPGANWVATVHHGLSANLLPFRSTKENYLAFLGRVSPEKNPEDAIEIARRAGMKIKIAAKIDEKDRAYHEQRVRPLLNQSHVEFLGEISDSMKPEFLGRAKALIFPINWPEPFGLVMIEALACGTPVIAYNNGSVPEIIEDGKTGLIVSSIDEAVAALDKLPSLEPYDCREAFETRFLDKHMACHYLNIYSSLIKKDEKRS